MKEKPIKIKPPVLSEEQVESIRLNFNTGICFVLTTGGQFTTRISLSPKDFIQAYNASRRTITLLGENGSYFSIKKKYIVCYHVSSIIEK